MDNKFLHLNELGELCATDLTTGEEEVLENKVQDPETLEKRFDAIVGKDGEMIYVPKSMSLSERKKLQGRYYSVPFSPLLAERILKRVSEGDRITRICKEPGMPSYYEFSKWRKDHDEFDLAYRQAVQARAEYFLDRALSEVEEAGADRDEVSLAKVRSDMYKYAAKIGDPDNFSERQNVRADVAVTGYVIDTGIRRPGDPGYHRDETRQVNNIIEGDKNGSGGQGEFGRTGEGGENGEDVNVGSGDD